MTAILKYLCYGTGTTLLLCGIVITGLWKHFFDKMLTSQLILSKNNGSQSRELWDSNSTVPTYFKVYLFNWTNAEASLSKKEKPAFHEVGPFVFRIRQLKDEISWNDNSTVSYRNKRRWDFIAELSNGSLSDRITTINAVAVTVANYCKYLSVIEKKLINPLLVYNERSLHVTKTVKELLFDGYNDKILTIAKLIEERLKRTFHLPPKFAWYYGKNVTESNMFNMYTGESNTSKLGSLYSWNYSTQGHSYDGECDTIKGSTGELWPINAAHDNNVSLFISDFCSSFPLYNVGRHSVNDIAGVQFEGTKETFDNGKKNENSRCYCPHNDCGQLAAGVRNSSICLGAPVFVSFPHFYAADQSYREGVIGMAPDVRKHQFRLILQKDSGLVLEIYARLQVNMLLEPIDGLDFFSGLPRVFLPALWFEEYAVIPADLVRRLQFTFNEIPNLLAGAGLILVILGTAILVINVIVNRKIAADTVPYTKMIVASINGFVDLYKITRIVLWILEVPHTLLWR